MGKRKITEKVRDFFSIVIKDPQRDSIPVILWEYFKYSFTNPAIAEQYFAKFLYRKGIDNYDDYMVTHKLQNIFWKMNDPHYNSIFDNKYLFEIFLRNHNLSVVNSFAYNINSLFFIDGSFEQINNEGEFRKFLMRVFALSNNDKTIFVKKTAGSGGGKNIFRINLKELETDKLLAEKLYKHVIADGYIFQEAIVQHEEINRLNPHCVNTMRIVSYTNQVKGSRIMGGVFRIGLNDSFVDNTSSGGVYVGIDFESGALKKEAFSDFTNGRAKTYFRHPVNNMEFNGFKIPFFTETVDLVIGSAALFPQVKIVGWDVALTPNGPVMVEGNELPSLVFEDITQNGLRKNPVFMDMYHEALLSR
jgi:hypothetical protein